MNQVLVGPEQLIPIEDYDRGRAKWLSDQILHDNKWTQPILISPRCLLWMVIIEEKRPYCSI